MIRKAVKVEDIRVGQEQIEELLRTKRYREASEKLRAVDATSLSPIDRALHCLQIAEVRFCLGDYAVDCIDSAIETYRHTHHTGRFARAKFLKGWQLIVRGEYIKAKATLLESYASYVRCGDAKGAARASNRMAYLAVKTGNVDAAAENLRDCIELFRRSQDELNATLMSHNLAHVYFLSGRLRQALEVYSAYPLPSMRVSEGKLFLNCHLMCAWVYTMRLDLGSASREYRKCQPLVADFPHERVIYYEYRGLVSVLQGEHDAAEATLRTGLDISLEIAPESALVSQIKRLFGDLYIATGKYDLAEKHATEALAVAEKINDRVEIAACHRVFAQVDQHRGNSAKAREWFKKAMDLFKMISSRYELAVTRYLAATSGLYEYGERAALLYTARGYFQSEEVTHYIETINQQLRRIQTSAVCRTRNSPAGNSATLPLPTKISHCKTITYEPDRSRLLLPCSR